jgi:integrase
MGQMKREIYPRHKATCPGAKANNPRKKFDGCRVYARYTITDPLTGLLLETFNGALPPHITTKDAADTYVNQRFGLVIDEHQKGGKVQSINKGATVRVAAQKYIADKKRLFPALPPVQTSDNVRRVYERLDLDPNARQPNIIGKIELLFGSRFPQFCEEHVPPIRYIRDVKYEHLVQFLDGQPGRTLSIIVDGVETKTQMPQSSVTKQKNQEFLKRFFRWLHVEAALIDTNPAERLKTIKLPKPKAPNPRFQETNEKMWTPEQVHAVRSAIPRACSNTKLCDHVAAFFEVCVYANPRITSVIQMECANLYDDLPAPDDPAGEHEYGIVYYEPKVNGWVDSWLPGHCYRLLKNLIPKSAKYFFWSGNGDPESWSKRYSQFLLKAFRLAGLPERHEGGPRIHQFRNTNSTGVMNQEEGKLQYAATALGHQRADGATAARYYVDNQAKLQNRKTNILKRQMFQENGLW